MESKYVFAVLGESPAVVTELLWWIGVDQRHHLAGLEIWATAEGAERLEALVDSDAWDALLRQTGPLPTPEVQKHTESTVGARIHIFEHRGKPLRDVRTAEEVVSVSAVLNDRMRALRNELPKRIGIVGSIAGGRKTVSSALQTAFCLQARSNDHLVHIVLDAEMERLLRRRDELRTYVFPTAEMAQSTGVPMCDQLCVHRVAFPRLRSLVPTRLTDALNQDWEEIWLCLDSPYSHGRLTNQGNGWTLTLEREGARVVVDLPDRLAIVLAAICSVDDRDTTSLLNWVDRARLQWQPPESSDHDTREGTIRSAIRDLRKRLRAELPVGAEGFVPAAQTLATQPIQVELQGSRR